MTVTASNANDSGLWLAYNARETSSNRRLDCSNTETCVTPFAHQSTRIEHDRDTDTGVTSSAT